MAQETAKKPFDGHDDAPQPSAPQTEAEVRNAALNGAMRAIAEHGWHDVTWDQMAQAGGVPASELTALFGDRFGLLADFGRLATVRAVRAAEAAGGSMAVRDRLFETIMARFDAVNAHRAAIRTLADAARRDPLLALFFAGQLQKTLRAIADASGVRTTGLAGLARVQGLGVVYARVVRVWFADESEDLGKTMAALDKALADAEQWAQRLPEA